MVGWIPNHVVFDPCKLNVSVGERKKVMARVDKSEQRVDSQKGEVKERSVSTGKIRGVENKTQILFGGTRPDSQRLRRQFAQSPMFGCSDD